MESHPSVLATVGVSQNHINANSQGQRITLTELDIVNGEDILMVAVDILLEIKQFEPTVLNPHNSAALAILEHA